MFIKQFQLEEESKKYTTANTTRKLHNYNCLPFGVSAAPSIFQRTMKNLLKDILHVLVYLDDILIFGKNDTDHLRSLQEGP